MIDFWSGRRVLVTGGSGFLGSHLVDALLAHGATLSAPRSSDYDLRRLVHAHRVLGISNPDIVFHLAANCGGIGKNRAHPATLLRDNALMGLNVIDACLSLRTPPKVIALGTVCAYPKFAPIPFVEPDLFNGRPEETNEAYGTAKRMLYIYLKACYDEFGLRYTYVLPTNLYGPRDHFGLEDSHVVPAMICKFIEADGSPVTLWGTGRPTRDFLYVTDCVTGLLLLAEQYDDTDPINLGSGHEVSIAELAHAVQAATGHSGEILWDATKPDGQPRRCVSSVMAHSLGWFPTASLHDGIQRTVDWYRSNQKWSLPPEATI